MELPIVQKEMIETFQCPGCCVGLNTTSNCYKPDKFSFHCNEHAAGTIIGGIGVVNLGLPKGFNRLHINKERSDSGTNNIRLYEKPEDMPEYNHLNVPVWAMEIEEEGHPYLLVRVYCPRVNWDFVDVIRNGKLTDVQKTHPNVYNVKDFIESID